MSDIANQLYNCVMSGDSVKFRAVLNNRHTSIRDTCNVLVQFESHVQYKYVKLAIRYKKDWRVALVSEMFAVLCKMEHTDTLRDFYRQFGSNINISYRDHLICHKANNGESIRFILDHFLIDVEIADMIRERL